MSDEVLRLAERAVELAWTDRPTAEELATAALADPAAGDEVRAVAAHARGLLALAVGDVDEAVAQFRHGVALADEACLPYRGAPLRGTLAYALTLTGATGEALATVDRALTMVDHGLIAARLRMQRAMVLTEASRFDEAEEEFERSLALLRGAGGETAEGGGPEADDAGEPATAVALLLGDIHTNRSFLRSRVHDWPGTELDLAAADAGYRAAGHVGRLTSVVHNRGAAAVMRGDLPAAFAYFDEAERSYRTQGRDMALLPVDRAEALLSVRLIDEALAAARSGVDEYERLGNAGDLVHARVVLARAALAAGDTCTAYSEARLAAAGAARQHRPGWGNAARHVELQARWSRGDRDDATLRFAGRIADRLARSGWTTSALDAQVIVACIALDLDRLDVAEAYLREAAEGRIVGPADVRIRAWYAEALLAHATGDDERAARALGEGMAVLDEFRAGLGATELRAHTSVVASDIARMGLRLADARNDVEGVLHWAERWRAGAILVRPALPPADDALRDDLTRLRSTVTAATAAAARGDDVAPFLREQAELERSIQSRTRHARGEAAGASRDPARPPTVTELRHGLQVGDGDVEAVNADEAAAGAEAAELGGAHGIDVDAAVPGPGRRALVEYVDLDGVLAAIVITDEVVELRRLGPVSGLDSIASALRYGLRRLAFRADSPSSALAAETLAQAKAEELDQMVIRPLADLVVDRSLIVVPTGALHAVPWAALPSARGCAVSVAPSAGLWLRARLAAPVTMSPRIDPSRVLLAAGPGLPHARAEVAGLARGYPGSLRFTGRRATVRAVLEALDGAGLAHIAAHGHFRADNPLFSSLQLADGPLTVYDVERLRTAPALVVLSACDSGMPTVHAGDELLGLAAALLALGTSSLIATLVPVPDDVTRVLMLRLHRHLRAGRRPAAALACAQRELVDDERAGPARLTVTGFACFGAG